jgi:hypothetical protein
MSGRTKKYVDMKVQNRRVMMFAKSNDPDSRKAKQIFSEYYLPNGKSKKKIIPSNFLGFLY